MEGGKALLRIGNLGMDDQGVQRPRNKSGVQFTGTTILLYLLPWLDQLIKKTPTQPNNGDPTSGMCRGAGGLDGQVDQKVFAQQAAILSSSQSSSGTQLTVEDDIFQIRNRDPSIPPSLRQNTIATVIQYAICLVLCSQLAWRWWRNTGLDRGDWTVAQAQEGKGKLGDTKMSLQLLLWLDQVMKQSPTTPRNGDTDSKHGWKDGSLDERTDQEAVALSGFKSSSGTEGRSMTCSFEMRNINTGIDARIRRIEKIKFESV